MTVQEPSPLDTPEWRKVPFAVQPKSSFDELVDILLQLPSCSFKFHQLQKAEGTRLDPAGLRKDIIEQTKDLLPQLNLLSAKYPVGKFHTAFQATFAACLHAAYVICWRYFNAVSGADEVLEPRMNWHAEKILECVHLLGSAGPHSGGSFTMSFPLKIVCLMVPDRHIRAQAQEALYNWGSQRGLEDLCQIAVPLCT